MVVHEESRLLVHGLVITLIPPLTHHPHSPLPQLMVTITTTSHTIHGTWMSKRG